ncbi:MAG: peroxiredoxin [Candidatus Acidiferrales bacterium]
MKNRENKQDFPRECPRQGEPSAVKMVRHAALAILVAIFVVAALTVVRAQDQAAPQPPAVGTAAPDFQLNSQEGTPVHLSDFRGKWVVLYFYPKDFTSGCTIEAHNFQADIDQYTKKNAVIVGVSVDSVDSHKGFCAKEGLNFKLLSDADHVVSAKYGSLRTGSMGAMAMRNTFIINPQGVIVKEFIGVQPTHHSEEVLAALTELQQAS